MKNAQYKRLLSLIIAIISFALYLTYFIYVLVVKKGETLAVIGFSLLGLVVSYLITSIIHELGHVVFGLINKLKLCYLKIFGLRFYKNEKGKFSVGLSRDGDIFGETAFYPSTGDDVTLKIGLTAFGGPIFSFIQTVIQLIVALTCIGNTAVLCIFGISFVMPLYTFIINVIPFSFEYDGHLAFTMLSGGKKALIASAYITASSLISSGTSPEELNGRCLTVYDENYGFYNVKIIRLRYLSSLINDENTAFTELDKISNVDKLPDGTYAEVLYELFFRALVLSNDDFIKTYREETLEYLDVDDSPTSFRVQVALCVYDGEYERAKLLVASGIKACSNYADKGMAKLEKQLLERFNDVLNEI